MINQPIMDKILDTLVDVFADTQNPLTIKPPLNYLDLKNGKLNYKIGYASTLDPFNPLPSIVLDTNAHFEEYSLKSSSIPIKFNFS